MNWKKTFAIIWTGQLVSLLSSTAVNFAIIIWLSIKTGSAEVLALAAIFALLPQSVIGLFSGVIVDRWNRKIVMILSDSFIAVCTLILSVIFYFGEAAIWQIYLLLALRSVGSAFHMPAMQAAIPTLAPESQLMRIAGINQSIQSVCNIAGPALGAFLISVMDISYVLLFDVAGAIIACTSLALITIPHPLREGGQKELHFLTEIKEGIMAIVQQTGIVWLFIFAILATFFIMPISVLFPLMTLNHFSGNAFQMSLIEIAWGIGMLTGGAFLGIQKKQLSKIILLNTAYLLLGGSFFFSGLLSPSAFASFVLLTFLGGISGTIFYSSFMVIVQTRIAPSVLGRVFSVYMSLSIIPSVFGLLGTGFIADQLGLTTSFVVAGVVIAVIGVASFLVPSIMKLDKPLGAPPDPS
jgi:DHA3 family macrolide efflux protein-like MFS transporter